MCFSKQSEFQFINFPMLLEGFFKPSCIFIKLCQVTDGLDGQRIFFTQFSGGGC